MKPVGDARFVPPGEGDARGTREFYRERARITRRLVGEKGFNAVIHFDVTGAVAPLK